MSVKWKTAPAVIEETIETIVEEVIDVKKPIDKKAKPQKKKVITKTKSKKGGKSANLDNTNNKQDSDEALDALIQETTDSKTDKKD